MRFAGTSSNSSSSISQITSSQLHHVFAHLCHLFSYSSCAHLSIRRLSVCLSIAVSLISCCLSFFLLFQLQPLSRQMSRSMKRSSSSCFRNSSCTQPCHLIMLLPFSSSCSLIIHALRTECIIIFMTMTLAMVMMMTAAAAAALVMSIIDESVSVCECVMHCYRMRLSLCVCVCCVSAITQAIAYA